MEAGSGRFKLCDESGREMEAGGGGGYCDALIVVGIDGLVALVVLTAAGILVRPFDVGGERKDAARILQRPCTCGG